jgi:hypothetical protein
VGRRRDIGRTKRLLAAQLTDALGTPVDPWQMWQNRNAERLGVARWGVWVVLGGRNVNVHSWDTMTVCVRFGFTCRVLWDGGSIEVSAQGDGNEG